MRAWQWLAGLLLAGAELSVQAAPAVRATLDNGLRVIVQPDRRAPVVITQVWYRVGSADEGPGQTGISHVLEHLMFKGTPRVPAGEFSRLVSYFGGDDNAFTTDQVTVYYQQHVADRVELALALEADRMAQPRLDAADFASELQVVIEERRLRTDDNPQALAMERFQAIANVVSSERTPTIGWPNDLAALTIEDARAWHARWYAPNNATLVVAGDVDPQAVIALAKRHFGPLKARPLPRRVTLRELPEPGQREVRLQLPGQVPALYLGWNWPGLASAERPEDAYALRLLAGILDEGLSARLEQALVRTSKAAAIRSSYDMLSRGDTLFTVTAVPAGGSSLEALREAILAEVSRLRDQPPAPEEIARVLANVVAQQVFSRDDVSDQARLLGQLDAAGLPGDWADTLADRLAAVTPEQVQAAARRYLVPARMTSLLLDLKPENQP